ncbi:MAG: HAD family phosphatase [Paraglaciecola sp.]|uniref:HAD family hydrolase n=1 Tax=Paraglaciecola sp. TaxID=1920173 RepID=UPI00329A7BD7
MTLSNYLQCNPIELIIFDCDGVLVDSEILSKQTLLKMLSELGATVSDEYFYRHFLGHNFEHVTAKVLEDFSVVLSEDFRFAYRDALLEVFTTELKPTLELDSILKNLHVKSCVATSSSPAKVSHALRATALNEYFSGKVFTASEVKKGKPAPDLFLHAAKKMGVAAEHCLVIEDSPAGIQGAKAANMRVIRYAGASHLIHHSYHDDVHTITHWEQLEHLIS